MAVGGAVDPAVSRALLAFGAALVAGAMNAVAGGGSFISFPTLVFLGLPPIVANATNNTAMWVGTMSSVGGYREELRGSRHLGVAIAIAAAGSVLGAELLLHTPEATFARLIPWLLLFATLLFATLLFGGSGRFGRTADGAKRPQERLGARWFPALFGVSIYGGYFGAGIGIVLLAMLALAGWTHIHRMNAVKALLTTAINGIAVVPFLVARKIAWEEAAVLTAGAVIGGYFGARTARRVDPRLVRLLVVAVGAGMTAYFFARGR
jgi:uncharacterized membrane protein YfcA